MKLNRLAAFVTMMLVSALTVQGVLAQAPSAPGAQNAAGTTWYVATTGDDAANDCLTTSTPCSTINGALGKAADGDTILVAGGTYTGTGSEVVLITKSITLSGGWDATFTAQSEVSVINGQKARQCMFVIGAITVIIDNFTIKNGYYSGDWGGGGIFSVNAQLTINNAYIINNEANSEGGGIYNSGTMVLNGVTISGNTLTADNGRGSGIHNTAGSMEVNNSTISGNLKADGIYAYSKFTLNNSTVSDNPIGVTGDDSVTILNSILAGNNQDCRTTSTTSTIKSSGYNIIGNKTGCIFKATIGDQVGTAAAPIDPLLGPLQDNGGPTFTHALLAGSPAINAGNPAAPGSGGNACLATDQRGAARPIGAACDIGAVENYTFVESVKRANPNPTPKEVVTFKVIFANAVTGVDITDFNLTTTGVEGASILSVDGADALYEVRVNAGTGDGTIRLNVKDDDSILDASGNPLGGAGIGNGNFRQGEKYNVWYNPGVVSIVRKNANPSYANKVQFTVTFSELVTGVDTAAPFNDFALITTGVKGASIYSVTGSNKVYTVTVNTGTGNGTIQLNVVDDDSITDALGNPLRGPGAGNGNKTGPQYNIKKAPYLVSPRGKIFDKTPTYKWYPVIGATKYQYQVVKDGKVVYTKIADASVCGASGCLHTPTTPLSPGTYQWRAQAMIGGAWRGFSNYASFRVVTPPTPKVGFWSGEVDFYITPDHAYVDNFTIYVTVYACNIYDQKLIYKPLVPIENNLFVHYKNGHYFSGTFNTATTATVEFGLDHYYLPGCGYISGGPFTASIVWKNFSRPTMDGADEPGPIIVLPALGAPEIFYDFDLIEP